MVAGYLNESPIGSNYCRRNSRSVATFALAAIDSQPPSRVGGWSVSTVALEVMSFSQSLATESLVDRQFQVKSGLP
ncbi:MAG: hypothetical protein KF752_14940 [Pirellulaceae bacterium]|nr:hypothetical protein [Pirellulaceae bacterium]